MNDTGKNGRGVGTMAEFRIEWTIAGTDRRAFCGSEVEAYDVAGALQDGGVPCSIVSAAAGRWVLMANLGAAGRDPVPAGVLHAAGDIVRDWDGIAPGGWVPVDADDMIALRDAVNDEPAVAVSGWGI